MTILITYRSDGKKKKKKITTCIRYIQSCLYIVLQIQITRIVWGSFVKCPEEFLTNPCEKNWCCNKFLCNKTLKLLNDFVLYRLTLSVCNDEMFTALIINWLFNFISLILQSNIRHGFLFSNIRFV